MAEPTGWGCAAEKCHPSAAHCVVRHDRALACAPSRSVGLARLHAGREFVPDEMRRWFMFFGKADGSDELNFADYSGCAGSDA